MNIRSSLRLRPSLSVSANALAPSPLSYQLFLTMTRSFEKQSSPRSVRLAISQGSTLSSLGSVTNHRSGDGQCALAAFEGPEVEEALAIALNDRDWQVRQIAETLMRTALVAPDDATGKP